MNGNFVCLLSFLRKMTGRPLIVAVYPLLDIVYGDNTVDVFLCRIKKIIRRPQFINILQAHGSLPYISFIRLVRFTKPNILIKGIFAQLISLALLDFFHEYL